MGNENSICNCYDLDLESKDLESKKFYQNAKQR